MTTFQQMTDCNGNPINLFTNQWYNILNENSEAGYLQLASDKLSLKVGTKGGGDVNNWVFESTDTKNYYSIKSQDAGAYTRVDSYTNYYLNYHDASLNLFSGDDEFMLFLSDPDGSSTQWCMTPKGAGFNIANRAPSTDKYMTWLDHNGVNIPIIANPRAYDIWTFKPSDYTVSAQTLSVTPQGTIGATTTIMSSDAPSSSIIQPLSSSISTTLNINNCGLTDSSVKQTEKQTIGAEVSHSIRISHSEHFSASVNLNIEASLGKIIGGLKAKIGAGLKWDTSNSQVSTSSAKQSIKYELDTSGVGVGQNVRYAISFSYVPDVKLPFITKSVVQAESNGQAVDNPGLIKVLLGDTGSNVIINDADTNADVSEVEQNFGYASDTYIIAETRGILSSTGTSGEFSQVTENIPCPTEIETDTQPPQHDDL
jgi:hypothetical protein